MVLVAINSDKTEVMRTPTITERMMLKSIPKNFINQIRVHSFFLVTSPED